MNYEILKNMNGIAVDMLRDDNESDIANKRMANLFALLSKQQSKIIDSLLAESSREELVTETFQLYNELCTGMQSMVDAFNERANGLNDGKVITSSSIIERINSKMTSLQAELIESKGKLKELETTESAYIAKQREKLSMVYNGVKHGDDDGVKCKLLELGIEYSELMDKVRELENENEQLTNELRSFEGIKKQRSKMKKGVKIAYKSDAEDEIIKKMYLDGVTVNNIAEQFGMTYHGIRARLINMKVWEKKPSGGQRKEK